MRLQSSSCGQGLTLYEASTLNLKIIWLKGLAFRLSSVPLIYTTKSRFEVVRYSEKWFHFIWKKWKNDQFMKIDRSFWYTNHVQWHTNHVREKNKINYYSWFLSRGTSWLTKWIYRDTNCSYWKENNNLITACKILCWNLCHVRSLSNVEFVIWVHVPKTPILVDESNQIRHLIQTSEMLVPKLTPFVVNIPSFLKIFYLIWMKGFYN